MLLLAAPGAGQAQAIPVPIPKNNILPNYDNVFIGSVEAVEAGAYLARTNNASASFYNPAGLAASGNTSLSISANGFVWTKLTSHALGESVSSSQLGATPGYFAVAVGPPIIKGERLRLGFSVINSVSWAPPGSDQATSAGPGSFPQLTYSSQLSFSTVLTSLSIGYRLTPTVRIGGSVSLASTSYSDQESLSGQVPGSGQPSQFLSALRASGNIRHLVLSSGVQWDATPQLTFGALLRAPGLPVTSSSLFTYESMVQSLSGGTNAYFRDDGGTFEYRLPLEVSAGVAYRLGSVHAEIDVRYHANAGQYTLYRSARPLQVQTYGPNGTTALSTQAFSEMTYSARSVVNVAAGARYQATRALTFHGGFFTSPSPVGNPANSPFQKADFYGATLGAAFTGAHWSFSLGFAYEFGSTAPVQVNGGLGPLTDLDYRALTLLYALGYRF